MTSSNRKFKVALVDGSKCEVFAAFVIVHTSGSLLFYDEIVVGRPDLVVEAYGAGKWSHVIDMSYVENP